MTLTVIPKMNNLQTNQVRSDQSDEDLRLVADSARDFAMIFTDVDRKVVRWSIGAEHVLGWTEAEVLGKDERDLIFTPEDQAAGIPQQEPDIALRDGRAEDNRWHMKKDGSRFWAIGVVTPLYDRDTGTLRGFGKILIDQTREKRLEEELREAARTLHLANEMLEARVAERTLALEERTAALAERTAELEAALAERQEILRRVVIAEEVERRRISRELHDQTGQHLTGLALGLQSLEESIRIHCSPEAGADAQLRPLRSMAEELARDLHRVAVDLRPTALDDLGLLPALESHVDRWSAASHIPAEFDSFGLEQRESGGVRLPELVETTVYRVVQEALTNVARHGTNEVTRATRVSVAVQRRSAQLQVTIEDNGPGFDVEAARRRGRLGLVGMAERAALCGGTVEIESEPGGGTTVYLRIPLAAQ
jgi:PAS domain S-box-containing protein